jgi:hypothetical protein
VDPWVEAAADARVAFDLHAALVAAAEKLVTWRRRCRTFSPL